MNGNESDLYRAAKAYVHAATRLLSEICPEGDQQSIGIQDWTRHSEGLWVLRDVVRPPWHPFRIGPDDLNKLHALHERTTFVEALQADQLIASQLGTLVGTMVAARSVRLDDATDRLIWMMAERCGRWEFSPTVFDDLFGQFSADFSRKEFEFTAIAPLPLFKTDSWPIELGEEIKIERLSDADIKRGLQVNLFHFIPPGSMAAIDAEFGVRFIYRLDKRVGETGSSETPDRLFRKVEDRIHDVLHALHLFKHGRLSHAGIITFSDQWPVDGGTWTLASRQTFAPGVGYFQLNASEEAEFRTFWERLERARSLKFINSAIRRFGYAGERNRPEDRLVDLMIAAESLFLNASERDELSFRLALRFAYYVDIPGFSRAERFKHMRNAYNARSALVHGGEQDPRLLALPSEGRVTLERFVEAVEQSVRLALVKAISFSPHSDRQLVDWDTLILG